MIDKRIYARSIYLMVSFLIALIYILFLCALPNEWFRDRYNYISYAANSSEIFDSYWGVAKYFNEPLFLHLNIFLSKYISAYQIPIIFILFICSVNMFFLIKRSNNILLFFLGVCFFLFFPYLIQMQLVTLRQGLATSVFMLGYFYLKNPIKVFIVCLICAFIHSIFFVISFYYLMNFIIFSEKSFKFKLIFNFIFALLVSIFSIFILSSLGMRQAEVYQAVEFSRGGGGFIVVGAIFLYLLFFFKEEDNKLYEFVVFGILIFLVLYFLNPIAGRLLNTISPFLVFLLVGKNTVFNVFVLSCIVLLYFILFYLGDYAILLDIDTAYFLDEFNLFFKKNIKL